MAVVTGAASGIGLATAERLVSDGASVVALDVANAPTAGRWDIGPVDVSNADQVERAVARIVEHHARIDVLVNNAGINIGGKVAEMGLHEWNEVIAVDLTGVFLCSKYVITHMEQQGGGVIVNVASQLGMVGFPAFAALQRRKRRPGKSDSKYGTRLRRRKYQSECCLPGPCRHAPYRESFRLAFARGALARLPGARRTRAAQATGARGGDCRLHRIPCLRRCLVRDRISSGGRRRVHGSMT